VFPFTWAGQTHYSCATWRWGGVNQGKKWCSTNTDSSGNHVNGQGYYGFCPSTSACVSNYYPGNELDIGIHNRDGFNVNGTQANDGAVSFGDDNASEDIGDAPDK
jgi:hypothetical protein